MLKDDARIKGIVNLVLRDEHGRVKQHKTIRNKVTDYGLAHIVGRMIDPQQDIRGTHVIPAMMSHMSIGTAQVRLELMTECFKLSPLLLLVYKLCGTLLLIESMVIFQ